MENRKEAAPLRRGVLKPVFLFALSADKPEELEMRAGDLSEYLADNCDVNLSDLAYSLHSGGSPFGYRCALVCRDREDALAALTEKGLSRILAGYPHPPRPVIFMFPGGGAQYVNMGAELYRHEPVFRDQVDNCCDLLEPLLGFDLRSRLYPGPSTFANGAEELKSLVVALPALFVTEYALSRLWMSWGIYPKAMIGHSLGEYVAACLSGVLSLENALSLVALRARLLQELPPAAMLSVSLSEEEVEPLMSTQISLAAVNAPSLCVISGSTLDIQEIERDIAARGVPTRRLQISGAGHWRGVEAIIEQFNEVALHIEPGTPSIPYISNVTGKWITGDDISTPGYWAKHLRQTVRFSDGVNLLLKDCESALLEVGPGQMLSTLVRQHVQPGATRVCLSSIRHPQDEQSDIEFILKTLGGLWVNGVSVDWEAYCQTEEHCTLELPDRNGKSLPLFARGKDQSQTAPRNDFERELATIWQEVLSKDEIGVEDNFFELGGHSLLGTRLLSRIRQKFGVDLPLRTLFETPSISSLAGTLRDALDSQAPRIPPISKAPRLDHIPLSFAQQQLWLFDQLSPANPAYNIVRALSISGSLDILALECSLDFIIARHEVLRTSFARSSASEPSQLINPHSPFQLPILDLPLIDDQEANVLVERLAFEFSQLPFDLASSPLFRARLLRLRSDRHFLLLSVHHIAFDGWSFNILINELASAYLSFSSGSLPSLSPLPIQYADFASWQRKFLSPEALQPQLDYWANLLNHRPDPIQLPADFQRPGVQSFRGSRLKSLLPELLSSQIKRFSQLTGVSPFMTLLAAFFALLWRYTNQRDLIIGSPVAARNRLDLEPLIGFFVNMLILRTTVDPNASFSQLVDQVRNLSLEAQANQDLPFEMLLEQLQVDRHLSHSPLFQVVFAFENSSSAFALNDLNVSDIDFDPLTSKYDLALFIGHLNNTFSIRLEYCSDLFLHSSISRFLDHFQYFLSAALDNPSSKLSDLQFLSPSERSRILVDWNHTHSHVSPLPVHKLIEYQALSNPLSPALSDPFSQLTFHDLNLRANRLAHFLISLGIGPDSIVALCFNRSVDLVLSALAVLKAGAAYLPLDPSHPNRRLLWMIDHSSASVVLSSSSLLQNTDGSSTTRLALDTLDHLLLDFSTDNPPLADLSPQNLAYVIYTSGSTGKPKGVMLDHSNLMNLVSWHQRVFNISPSDRASLLAGVSFDASVWEIWPYLASGASIHIPDDLVPLSPHSLGLWLAHLQISISFLPTPLAEAFIEHHKHAGWPQRLALRSLLTGGDKLHRPVCSLLPFDLFNNYGPTENTVVASMAKVPSHLNPGSSPSIGTPIDNSQIFILDEFLQPVPVAVEGDLFIAGSSLARGYLARPDLSADSFLPNPFGPPGSRLYKTGDRARFLPNGEIDFLGRSDHQLKLRGFRIELGEIEAALSLHHHIKEAVVVPRIINDSTSLVAFLVPRPPHHLNFHNLKNYLKDLVPDYMIPSHFLSIDSLPLTPNGKLDRSALLLIPVDRQEAGAATSEPANELEQMIAGFWRQVLGTAQVGRTDNFFDLGGHSLAMVKVHERLTSALSSQSALTNLTLVDMFEHPTVSALAQHLRRAAKNEIALDKVRGRAQKQKDVSSGRRASKSRRQAKTACAADLTGIGN